MPKLPYKPEKAEGNDKDYEIVSFEDFCDKSPGSKPDLLTLNDNINYRLCFESDKSIKYETVGESSQGNDKQSETSLSGKNASGSKISGSFAPFGRYTGKARKSQSTEEPGSREHRYQRFSSNRNWLPRLWESVPSLGPGVLGMAVVVALCIGVWWAVSGALAGSWGEEHYRKLWERAHPNSIPKTLSTIPSEKVLSEIRYHDHGNLSPKNKNATEVVTKKKTEVYKKTADIPESICLDLPDNMRFDCAPGHDENVCKQRGCCWKPTSTKGAPYCFYPPYYVSYKFVNMTENKHGMQVMYALNRPSGYPGDFDMVAMDVRYLSDDSLQIKVSSDYVSYKFVKMTENKHGMQVMYALNRPSGYPGDFDMVAMDVRYLSDDSLQIKLYDPGNKRFEVPIPEVPMIPTSISQLKYRVQLDDSALGFQVVRVSDNVTILNTDNTAAMILSEKFLQFSTLLPTGHIYGIGEQNTNFKKDMNWQTYSLYNTDQAPWEPSIQPEYGSHPFYLAVEHDGNSHGVLLFNSNAMDVVLQPTPAVTFRTIGGILNVVIFTGPSPREVISQYTAFIGRPFMPPYWSLGFHLCKFGYSDLNATRNVWKTNRAAGLPFDVQWNDIDYMDGHKDFTYDPVKYAGLSKFVKEVHSKGMHYVSMFDPGISGVEKPGTYPPFDRGLEYDIFVKNSSNDVFFGKVWSGDATAYPDFTHPNITSYWVEMMKNFHNKVPYDGAWIDMNEPSNFVDGQLTVGCEPEDLPYKPAHVNSLKWKTLCPEAKQHMGTHYDVHNLYSLSEAITMNFALKEVRGKRPFIISRSSFPGLGRYAGHWSGDISSRWSEMRYTIPALLSFSIFGIPMMGADICGFGENTTVPLCKRWMQLGAFYPFSRNHNDIAAMPQDPVSMGPEVLNASITALRLRYKVLPYYYTLFWRAHVFGDTVVRPLFFEDPSNVRLHSIEDQFLIGPHVMITPILTEDSETTKPYYPGPENWYNLATGTFIASDETKVITDQDMVAVKGGAILPTQDPPAKGPVSTTNSRSNPFQLVVVPAADGKATGELYWDDGDSLNTYEEKKFTHIEFTLKDNIIRNKVNWWGYGVPAVNYVTVYGVSRPKSVQVDGKNVSFNYIVNVKRLEILDLDLSLDKQFNIKWF